MTSEWNRALNAAQRVLEGRIASLRPRESGQPGNMVPDPRESGLRLAVSEIRSLIEPTESRNES